MNIKKKSIIIPAFALLIGASLAGSITGTVAWYQYSTRVNVAHYNVSGGATGNLQMRIKDDNYGANGDWITTLSAKEIRQYLDSQGYGDDVLPITSGALDKDAAAPADDGFYMNPRVGYGPYSTWVKASKANFIRIPLQLRYIDRDGQYNNVNGNVTDDEEVAKEVYLSDLVLQKDAAQNEIGDISNALRFHVYSYQDDLDEDSGDVQNPADKIVDGSKLNHLISKNGGTTIVEGKLDLDDNGVNDRGYTVADKKYGDFNESNELTEIIYGREYNTYNQNPYVALSQTSYSAGFDVVEKKDDQHPNGAVYYDSNNVAQPEKENIYPAVVEEDEFYDLTNLSYENEQAAEKSKAIGSTIAKDPSDPHYDDFKDDYLNVVITVWVEGWHKMVNKTPILDANGDPVLDNENNKTYSEEISSIWNFEFIDSAFNVGFEFGVDGDPNTL